MARRRRYYRRPDDWKIIYDVEDDMGKFTFSVVKEFTAYEVDEVLKMFNFWREGEERHYGCKINGREILRVYEDPLDEHPENDL